MKVSFSMNITKSVYNIITFLSIAGLTFCSPSALYAMTEAPAQQNPVTTASSTPNAQLPELLDKVLNGQATAAEYRQVLIAVITTDVEPLAQAAKATGDTAVHADLMRAADAAKAIHSNP